MPNTLSDIVKIALLSVIPYSWPLSCRAGRMQAWSEVVGDKSGKPGQAWPLPSCQPGELREQEGILPAACGSGCDGRSSRSSPRLLTVSQGKLPPE